jgi:hypothetical protein
MSKKSTKTYPPHDCSPTIIKHPYLYRSKEKFPERSLTIFELAKFFCWKIDWVIMTRRDLTLLVESQSRRRQYRREQKDQYTDQLRKTLECLDDQIKEYEDICIDVNFPQMVIDSHYLYGKLEPIISQEFNEFSAIWETVANPEYIHF